MSTAPVRTQPIPPVPAPPAETQQISVGRAGYGRRLAVYRGNPLRWSDLLLVFFPASLLVILPLAYGLYRAWIAYTRFGPAAAGAWARPWYMLATLALIPLTLLACYRLYQASRFVAVYEGGLRLRLSPFGYRRLAWSQIAGIAVAAYEDRFLGLPLWTRSQATLYPNQGRPIQLNARLQDLPALTRQVKGILYPRLWPALGADLQVGRWVHFGRLAVHRQSLSFSGRQIPWERVTALAVRSGYLVVELETGRRLRLAVARIPNLELLLQLVEWGINP
jgi:hypothetical protein